MENKARTKRGHKALKILLTVALAVLVLLGAVYLNHRVRLGREAELRAPLGQLVEVDGHRMSVYTEGAGETTLVFLSGGGTCSPILDFRSLYSLLSGQYRVAVVEKLGYGFSDVVDEPRPLEVILADTRGALRAAGVEPPYVLCPHSMSGLEALYWAQTFPGEVSAIVGLDMAVPEHYDGMEISMPLLRLGQWAANVGLTRLIPGVWKGDAVRHGTLTEEEKDIYRAVFYSRTATDTMLREVEAVRANAALVAQGETPQLPMLLFVSDGSGGTGFDRETWRGIARAYLAGVEGGQLIELECPHYVHDYEYAAISAAMAEFLAGVAAPPA